MSLGGINYLAFNLQVPGSNQAGTLHGLVSAWVFPGVILWGFPPTSKTETSFIVFSIGFLAITVIKFTFVRVKGLTTRINEINCKTQLVLFCFSEPSTPKKCRARFGVDQQEFWCKPCRFVYFIYLFITCCQSFFTEPLPLFPWAQFHRAAKHNKIFVA